MRAFRGRALHRPSLHQGMAGCPSTARFGRALSVNGASKLARYFSFQEGCRSCSQLRPSNEALLRARVSLYSSQCSFQACLLICPRGWPAWSPTARVQRGESPTAFPTFCPLPREQPACPSTARVGRGPSEAARSARCATRGRTSVMFAHAGETVSRQCRRRTTGRSLSSSPLNLPPTPS